MVECRTGIGPTFAQSESISRFTVNKVQTCLIVCFFLSSSILHFLSSFSPLTTSHSRWQRLPEPSDRGSFLWKWSFSFPPSPNGCSILYYRFFFKRQYTEMPNDYLLFNIISGSIWVCKSKEESWMAHSKLNVLLRAFHIFKCIPENCLLLSLTPD